MIIIHPIEHKSSHAERSRSSHAERSRSSAYGSSFDSAQDDSVQYDSAQDDQISPILFVVLHMHFNNNRVHVNH
jgi:hypothetical protein